MIAKDCVAQRHLVIREPSQPYRPCPNYCDCWCHKPQEPEKDMWDYLPRDPRKWPGWEGTKPNKWGDLGTEPAVLDPDTKPGVERLPDTQLSKPD